MASETVQVDTACVVVRGEEERERHECQGVDSHTQLGLEDQGVASHTQPGLEDQGVASRAGEEEQIPVTRIPSIAHTLRSTKDDSPHQPLVEPLGPASNVHTEIGDGIEVASHSHSDTTEHSHHTPTHPSAITSGEVIHYPPPQTSMVVHAEVHISADTDNVIGTPHAPTSSTLAVESLPSSTHTTHITQTPPQCDVIRSDVIEGTLEKGIVEPDISETSSDVTIPLVYSADVMECHGEVTSQVTNITPLNADVTPIAVDAIPLPGNATSITSPHVTKLLPEVSMASEDLTNGDSTSSGVERDNELDSDSVCSGSQRDSSQSVTSRKERNRDDRYKNRDRNHEGDRDWYRTRDRRDRSRERESDRNRNHRRLPARKRRSSSPSSKSARTTNNNTVDKVPQGEPARCRRTRTTRQKVSR